MFRKIVKISLITSALLMLIYGNVFAADDKYTTSTTINGVTVNWTYELNESNQIIYLKCTNPAELTGNLEVPATLDEKTVVQLNSQAFLGATNITSVTIPNTIKEIGHTAFKNCSNLENVNLGQIEKISLNVFQNCPKLTTVTLPRTLINGPGDVDEGVFTGTTNLTSVTFEEGTTVIADGILKDCKGITEVEIPSTVTKLGIRAIANTSISEISLPDSVKEIGYNCFEENENLAMVDLGKIERISFEVFKDCPKLTSITIPKTLVNGPGDVNEGVFTGTTNLTSVTFEEGTTTIADGILKDCKGITEVEIPNTVTKIGERAFANSGITELVLPNSVTEIKYYAFNDCTDLTKITILDNCTKVGWFSSQPNKETVFQNHNENLTIYCYEDSKIAEYAIANNIKYVYLTRPSTEGGGEDNREEDKNPSVKDPVKKPTQGKEDDTIANRVLPNAGVNITIIISLITLIIISIVIYKKYYNYKDIK